MSGETQHFDDDRLLAFALGLEDDPDLEAALTDDPALHARLDAMRADVGAVAAGLDRVVPAAPDDYADLSDPRWRELRDLVAAPAPAPAAPRRRPVWLRVLAPAAAIALVLVAGVVGVQQLRTVGGDEAATVAQDEKTAESSDRDGGALSGAPGAEGSDGTYGDNGLEAFWDAVPDRDAYEIVVIGRALAPTAERQLFEVLRVLRGEAEGYISLRMTGRALAPETRAVLYLKPAGEARSAPPTPAPQSSATGTGASSRVFIYRFGGAPALAQPVPSDLNVDSLALP